MGYVSFALESSGAFRVMFDASLKPFTRFPGLSEAAFEALSELHRVLRDGVTAGVFRADDVDDSVMAAWSTITRTTAGAATSALASAGISTTRASPSAKRRRARS